MEKYAVNSFDAVVIGGGPAGATTACLLARAGWSVAVVESKAFPRRKVCGEYLSATNLPLLRKLGIATEFCAMAGPPVTKTAIFVGNSTATATLPHAISTPDSWGRALCRERLDVLLLDCATRAGAHVLQPCRCTAVLPETDGFKVHVLPSNSSATEIHARIVVAAHGSWDLGELPTQPNLLTHASHDWLGFKAHFRNAALAEGLMPLLSFVDGYGGMVHCDNGLVSLSCCIQRRRLEQLQRNPGCSAGDAVFNHIQNSTPILRPIFETAAIAGPWLSVGPLRLGVRSCFKNDMFLVGNAAGEAHPVVAEGISMAMQSAWLLVDQLLPHREQIGHPDVRAKVAKSYSTTWRQSFLPRIRFAAAVAQWAKRPTLVAATLPWLRCWPGILTWGAGLSGKDRHVADFR